eukprot:6199978-Pleurochrysis_carterae.AAC.4
MHASRPQARTLALRHALSHERRSQHAAPFPTSATARRRVNEKLGAELRKRGTGGWDTGGRAGEEGKAGVPGVRKQAERENGRGEAEAEAEGEGEGEGEARGSCQKREKCLNWVDRSWATTSTRPAVSRWYSSSP